MIPENKEILNQIEDVIAYSQDIDRDKINFQRNFDLWRTNKYKIYNELFGGQLIIDFGEIEIHGSNGEDEADLLINYICNNVPEEELNDTIFDFIRDNIEGIMANKVVSTFLPDISIGMKLSKAFKFFILGSYLDKVQTYYSMIIQKNKISGHFYMSIHPLDYLSSSENSNSWRSCHSLDGEYRAGNLQYMCDPSTIVCYIASPRKEQISRFPSNVPWNSKKWRMLLFVNDNFSFMMNGRQYPMDLGSIMLEKVKNCMNKLLIDGSNRRYPDFDYTIPLFSQWNNDYLTSYNGVKLDTKYLLRGNKLVTIDSVLMTPKTQLFYNDLLYSHYYIPSYARINGMDFGASIKIGVPVYCCIDNENQLSISNSMVCIDCSDLVQCDDCNNLFRSSDLIYLPYYDSYVCEECYNNYYNVCDECGETRNNDDLW